MFKGENYFGLTFGAHTRDAYFGLEEGWATTPNGTPTDLYMWRMFISAYGDRCKTTGKVTAISFPKVSRMHWTEQERDDELSYYFNKIQDETFLQRLTGPDEDPCGVLAFG